MKRIIILALVAVLAVSVVGPAAAKKKKKPKPTAPVTTQVDQKFFLRRDDCGGEDNTRLSLVDGPDAACSWDDAGVGWEVYRELGPVAIDATNTFPAADGMPLTLDASKHVTGELTLYHNITCATGPACTPVPVNVGEATFTLRVVATVDGEDKEIGVVEESFTTTPGETHTVKLDVPIDEALNGVAIEGFRIEAFHGGKAIGPGGIEYDDPASYVVVPSLVTQ